LKIIETKEGAVLDVYVRPRSKEFKVLLEGDEIVVHCREEPVAGRVNRELLKELSKVFGKKVELVSGSSSKSKRLLVKNARKKDVEQALI